MVLSRPGAEVLCTRVLEYIFEILVLVEIMVMYSYSCSMYSAFTSTLRVHLSTFLILYWLKLFNFLFYQIINNEIKVKCYVLARLACTSAELYIFYNAGSLKILLLCQFYCNNHDINCKVIAPDL